MPSRKWTATMPVDHTQPPRENALRRFDAVPARRFSEFSNNSIGLEKERMSVAGWLKAGHCRAPYYIAPEEYLEGARKSGLDWVELHRRDWIVRKVCRRSPIPTSGTCEARLAECSLHFDQ